MEVLPLSLGLMLNVDHLIQSGGLLIIALIVFAESGLLIGFFLPGDTLLLSAGVFAAQGKLPLLLTIATIIIANILGNETGYQIGHRTGKRIFTKSDGILFRREYVLRAEAFYEKHGGKTIVLARFIPIVRTFAAVVAGVGSMPKRVFLIYNVIGAILWGSAVTLIGYWFGSRIPNIDHYITPTILAVVVISFGPALYHLFKERRKIIAKLKKSKK